MSEEKKGLAIKKTTQKENKSRRHHTVQPKEILGGTVVGKAGAGKTAMTAFSTNSPNGFTYVELGIGDSKEKLIEQNFEQIESIRTQSRKDWKEIEKLKKETKKLLMEMQS